VYCSGYLFRSIRHSLRQVIGPELRDPQHQCEKSLDSGYKPRARARYLTLSITVSTIASDQSHRRSLPHGKLSEHRLREHLPAHHLNAPSQGSHIRHWRRPNNLAPKSHRRLRTRKRDPARLPQLRNVPARMGGSSLTVVRLPSRMRGPSWRRAS
jgi:hypothetical protein